MVSVSSQKQVSSKEAKFTISMQLEQLPIQLGELEHPQLDDYAIPSVQTLSGCVMSCSRNVWQVLQYLVKVWSSFRGRNIGVWDGTQCHMPPERVKNGRIWGSFQFSWNLKQ